MNCSQIKSNINNFTFKTKVKMKETHTNTQTKVTDTPTDTAKDANRLYDRLRKICRADFLKN